MKKLLAVVLTILAAPLTSTAFADIGASTSGKCPTNYTPYTNKGGHAMCRSPEKKSAEKASKPSSQGSSSGSGSGPTYVDPVMAELPKANKLGFCPTGFYSDQDNGRCVTDMQNAPKVTLKTSACPSSTMEEHGAFCTQTIADTSDAMIGNLSGRAIRDFNAVYLALQIERKPLPVDQVNPPALAAAIAKRAAEGNPYKTAMQRDAEKNAPAQAAAQKASDDENAALAKSRDDAMRSACQQQAAAGIVQPQCVQYVGAGASKATVATGGDTQATPAAKAKEEAAKALGGVLKGLLGR